MMRFSVLVFLVAASLAKSQETEQRSVSETYELAQALYDTTERLQNALALFQEVAARDSSFCCWKKYVYIANIYLKWRNVAAAKAILQEAENRLESSPKFYEKENLLFNIWVYQQEVSSGSLLDMLKISDEGIGCDVMSGPELIGGLSKMESELEYPQDILEKAVIDTVFVTFHLSWRGDVYFPKIRKGGKFQSLKETAIKAVYHAKWQPASCGLPTCCWVTIPIKFNSRK